MKALVYTAPGRLSYRDADDPVRADGEALIRVEAVGICGSDMHAFLGHDARRPAPLILGHEAAGTIVGGARDGARVTINPLVTCGTCPMCRAGRENLCPDRQIISMQPRQGAFAQFVALPGANLVEVPENVPLARAALAEPLAVGWHAARLARAAVADPDAARALVIGGGAIGLACALSLRAMGTPAPRILEPNGARRAFLNTRCGQSATSEAPGCAGILIDAVGLAATRAVASAQAEPGGVIVHVGLAEDTGGLDVRRLTLQEIAFLGAYTYTAQDFRDTAAAIFDGRLGPLDWYETRPLSSGQGAFADLGAGRVAAPKIVLDPWADADEGPAGRSGRTVTPRGTG
ncbi:alcohol dehydrogenase catalytic domain-containing protein [Jannaschia sp. S6380]|uniref:alcohol dehydrogenase catalytic domain-containing protein n=1 Tax=Jannaschia sp. S6380 TaxID=2926408 RepID=UPI001FF13B46|nr:alcohol dehydrogenase catalytic domain-containing protein [Jannaschia sp. S6380]MCK0167695.1 alcohol dehydrogenase catalytic domain-containing protein [Jannaschia sp. S6380]